MGKHKTPGRNLKAPSLAMLRAIHDAQLQGAEGVLRTQLIEQLLRMLPADRARKSSLSTLGNLEAMDFIVRRHIGGRTHFVLSDRGMQTMADRAAPPPPPKPRTRAPRVATPALAAPVSVAPGVASTRAAYGSGFVSIPVAPRSVFELGGFA